MHQWQKSMRPHVYYLYILVALYILYMPQSISEAAVLSCLFYIINGF